MPDVEIRPFSDEHLDAAARLLRDRHERHRNAFPELPGEVDCRAEIAALLERGATGAFTDGRADVGEPGAGRRRAEHDGVVGRGHDDEPRPREQRDARH